MKSRLFSVSFGPLVDGKPSKVQIVLAHSFGQVADFCEDVSCPSEVLSIHLLPDEPVIL